MKQDELHNLWDDYRDGTLDAEQRRAFEQAVADDPRAAELFAAESQWLDALAEVETPAASDDVFTRGVMDAWGAPAQQPVLARIGWGRFAAAAGVAIAATITLIVWINQPNVTNNTKPTGPVAGGPRGTPTAPVAQPDPVGAMLRNVDAQVSQQPVRLRQAVSETVALLDVKNVMNLLEVPVPDPAQYVEPTDPAKKG